MFYKDILSNKGLVLLSLMEADKTSYHMTSLSGYLVTLNRVGTVTYFKTSAVSLLSWLNYYVLEILSMISRSYQHIKFSILSHYHKLIISSSKDIIPFIFTHNLKISNGIL